MENNSTNDLSDSISLWLFIIIPVIFLISLTVYVILKSKELNWMKLLGFSLILAGGIGNIIDRILFDRRVTDFMIVGIQNIRSGIFNFADLYVTIGVIALMNLTQVGDYTIQITDMTGRLINSETVSMQQGENLVKLSVQNYAAGLYMVRVSDSISNFNMKLTVVK